MAKFSSEEKIQAVKRYVNGGESGLDIARSIGVHNSNLHQWIKQYELFGEDVFQKNYTTYSVEYKLDVLSYMNEQGTSIRETAAIFNIPSPETLRKWKVAYETRGVDALNAKKKGRSSMKNEDQNVRKKPIPTKDSIEDLQSELEYLRAENAYLKKLQFLSSGERKIKTKEKALVVNELRKEFALDILLHIAEIKRSTFYYWIKKSANPDPDIEIKTLIQSIYDEHKGRYGYRRIRDELRNRGYQVNHKKVQRIMKELGLVSLVRIKKYRSYKGKVGKIAPNILERNFTAEKPNEKWVTDITEFKLFGEKLYLSPILDLFNGEIITYTIGSRPSYSLVSDMLDQSFERLTGDENLIIHSDQGWHYQMKQYRHALKGQGITQSMSRKGNCYDNAVIENFFGIMKSEFLYLSEFNSIAQFKQELKKYMDYYNNKRIKAKLKGMSPIQYRIHAYQAA
nr:IS3 family transposase [Bacillus subtilis]